MHRTRTLISLFFIVPFCLWRCSADKGQENADKTSETSASRRIVTLHPVVTQTVFALGRGDQIVATDKSSQATAQARKLPKLGYHRMLNTEGLLKHEPTLVLATGASGPEKVLTQVEEAGVNVKELQAPSSFETAYQLIRKLGQQLERPQQADSLIQALKAEVDSAEAIAQAAKTQPSVLPCYARGGPSKLFYIGKGNTAANMVQQAGGRLAIDREGTQQLTAEAVIGAEPDVLLVSESTLKMLGGPKGIRQHPFLGKTPAAEQERILTLPDGQLMGISPASGATLVRLAEQMHQ
jgi:iron complex transport system substrate-binding protein